MPATTLSSWALLIARELASRGVDAQEVFAEAGVPFASIDDPNARLPISAMQKLWGLAAEAADDAGFGVSVGSRWHPTTFHAIGYAALASASLREALHCLERYCRVVSTGVGISLVARPGEVEVRTSSQFMQPSMRPSVASDLHYASVHAALAAIVTLCNAVRGAPVEPRRVVLVEAATAGSSHLREFFRCEIVFDAGHDAVVFADGTLDSALPTSNPLLLEISKQALHRYLAHVNVRTLSDRVRAHLLHTLPTGESDPAAVARSLNLSLRSMQRKLQEEGTTFRILLDELRSSLSHEYARDVTVSSADMAYLLGFTDARSLPRALRRWKGVESVPA